MESTDGEKAEHPDGGRLIRLRYAGVCEVCRASLAAGSDAWHDPARKKVRCVGCVDVLTSDPGPPPPESGVAGRSAERRYQRLSQRHQQRVEAEIARDSAWREQARQDRPVWGRVVTALTPKPTVGPEPQQVRAWKTGADGERVVGKRLDDWAESMGGRVLHDRRIGRGGANIDHIAVNSVGVWVIDAKEYKGRVSASGGGLVSEPDLRVAGRRKTGLADDVIEQMTRVAAVLDAAAGGQPRPPVYGVLCFVGADWPTFGGTFTVRGVTVAWPSAAIKLLTKSGRADTATWLDHYTTVLADAFPPA